MTVPPVLPRRRRVARPSDDLDAVVRFYCDGLAACWKQRLN